MMGGAPRRRRRRRRRLRRGGSDVPDAAAAAAARGGEQRNAREDVRLLVYQRLRQLRRAEIQAYVRRGPTPPECAPLADAALVIHLFVIFVYEGGGY